MLGPSTQGSVKMFDKTANDADPVSFAERIANSDVFAALFRDGMALAEETATYLDGRGRGESKNWSGWRRWPMPPKACALRRG